MAALNQDERQAWRGFLRVHDELWKALDRELAAEYGLNLPAYELLLLLEEAGDEGIRMSSLAKSLRYTFGGLTRLADTLQASGYLERRRCPDDGRGYLAVLTPEGKQRLLRIHVTHLASVRRRFLSKLSSDELQTLSAIWDKVSSKEPTP